MLLQLFRHGRGASSPVAPIGTTGILHTRNVFVHVYACRMGDRAVLFDTGIDRLGRPVDRLLTALGCGRGDVSDLFLTHGHPDHVAGAPLFDEAVVHAGARDQARFLGTESGCKRAERIYRSLLVTPRVDVTDPLFETTTVRCAAGEVVEAVPLPGDTPGAFAFYLRRTLFVGDAMDYRGGHLVPAMGFATDDPAENRRSIVRLEEAFAERPLDYVCTAHGGSTPDGQARGLLADVAQRCRS